MSINLSSTKTITKQEEVSVSVNSVKIERIIDLPSLKKIKVKLDVFDDIIELSALSDSNYGGDWTYSSLNSVIKNYIETL